MTSWGKAACWCGVAFYGALGLLFFAAGVVGLATAGPTLGVFCCLASVVLYGWTVFALVRLATGVTR